jgi:transcription antitermination factor NusG
VCRPSPRSRRIVALFPSYLFVSITDRWVCLLSTGGVLDVIRSGDRPAIVKPHEIARMKSQEDGNGVIELPLTKFQPGERVRVTRGPLAERVGIYAGMSARDRVRIMFTMFERQVQIELREQDVISAA